MAATEEPADLAPLRVTVGDDVKLSSGERAVVRFVGEIAGKEGIFYGMELRDGAGKNNGTVGPVAYFACKLKRRDVKTGAFKRLDRIAKIKTKSSVIGDVCIGDRVQVHSSKHQGEGIVRYIGVPQIQPPTQHVYIGVELDEESPKGSDGTIKNTQYFNCEPGHGVYIRGEDIDRVGPDGEVISLAPQNVSPSAGRKPSPRRVNAARSPNASPRSRVAGRGRREPKGAAPARDARRGRGRARGRGRETGAASRRGRGVKSPTAGRGRAGRGKRNSTSSRPSSNRSSPAKRPSASGRGRRSKRPSTTVPLEEDVQEPDELPRSASPRPDEEAVPAHVDESKDNEATTTTPPADEDLEANGEAPSEVEVPPEEAPSPVEAEGEKQKKPARHIKMNSAVFGALDELDADGLALMSLLAEEDPPSDTPPTPDAVDGVADDKRRSLAPEPPENVVEEAVKARDETPPLPNIVEESERPADTEQSPPDSPSPEPNPPHESPEPQDEAQSSPSAERPSTPQEAIPDAYQICGLTQEDVHRALSRTYEIVEDGESFLMPHNIALDIVSTQSGEENVHLNSIAGVTFFVCNAIETLWPELSQSEDSRGLPLRAM